MYIQLSPGGSRCHIKPLFVCLHGFCCFAYLIFFLGKVGKVDLCLLVNIRLWDSKISQILSKNCDLRQTSWRAIARHRSKIVPFRKARGVREGIPFQIPILNPSICVAENGAFQSSSAQQSLENAMGHSSASLTRVFNKFAFYEVFIMFLPWRFHGMDWSNTRYFNPFPKSVGNAQTSASRSQGTQKVRIMNCSFPVFSTQVFMCLFLERYLKWSNSNFQKLSILWRRNVFDNMAMVLCTVIQCWEECTCTHVLDSKTLCSVVDSSVFFE